MKGQNKDAAEAVSAPPPLLHLSLSLSLFLLSVCPSLFARVGSATEASLKALIAAGQVKSSQLLINFSAVMMHDFSAIEKR